jgi:hypothetical protein
MAIIHQVTARIRVNHPFGGLDDVQIVFDDHDRVALVHEAAEDFH